MGYGLKEKDRGWREGREKKGKGVGRGGRDGKEERGREGKREGKGSREEGIEFPFFFPKLNAWYCGDIV